MMKVITFFKQWFSTGTRLKGIQWSLLFDYVQTAIVSTISSALTIMLLSAGIIQLTSWQPIIENMLGVPLFSSAYFIIVATFSIVTFVCSIIVSVKNGFTKGRHIKKALEKVADTADAFSRGKLDGRLQIQNDYDEFQQIGHQFNEIANRYEKQVESLQRLVTQNESLIQEAQRAAALDERRNLARDLHDAVSQQLFAISMTMAALPRLIQQDKVKAVQQMERVENMVRIAQQELRALIMHLRPVTLEGVSLAEGIEQLMEELQQKNPEMTMSWSIQQRKPWAQGIENQLFRTIQEAISNMLRHAQASTFSLYLAEESERAILLLEDNGRGFDTTQQKKSSYGITMMEERVTDLGGRFDLFSYPGKGTRIEIRVPIQVDKSSK